MSEERSGLTMLLEALFTVTIVASVAVIAVPKYDDMERREAAEKVLADIEVVRTAVYAFYSDSAYFPQETPDGLTPENLAPYLPRNFALRRPYGTITYRNWPVTNVAQSSGTAGNVVGATLSTRDPKIGATAAALSPGLAKFTVGDRHTFLFFGS